MASKIDTLHKVIGALALIGPMFNSRNLNKIIASATSVDSLISSLEDAGSLQTLKKEKQVKVNRSPKKTFRS